MRRILKGLRDTAGASLIEGAIVTPLLLLLTFGIVDFASLFYVYLSLENGVSQATRYGVTGNQMDDPDHPGGQLSREDSIKSAMRAATPTLTIPDGAFNFTHLAAGSGSWSAGPGGPNEIQKVAITYTWRPMTPLIKPFFPGGKLVLTVDSTMKNEGRFQ